MNLNIGMEALTKLGDFLLKYTSEDPSYSNKEQVYVNRLDQAVTAAKQHNGWYTKENILFSLQAWGKELQKENLLTHVGTNDFNFKIRKTIAIIEQSHVPLENFSDVLNILLTGHKALVRENTGNKHLLPWIQYFLTEQNEWFSGLLELTDKPLKQFDAVIATENPNKAKYFERYFVDKPHIIRKTKNSVAVLKGNESSAELKQLSKDIFGYFGLSRHNVSKLFVPQGHDFTSFFEAIYPWNSLINHHRYASNYDYNKAVYLMSKFRVLENGFLILKEDDAYKSPVACLYYEYYEDENQLNNRLKKDSKQIERTVSHRKGINAVGFGESQKPKLNDYPDDVDIMKFLTEL